MIPCITFPCSFQCNITSNWSSFKIKNRIWITQIPSHSPISFSFIWMRRFYYVFSAWYWFCNYLIIIYKWYHLIYKWILYTFETTYWHCHCTWYLPSSSIYVIISYLKSQWFSIYWTRCPKICNISVLIYLSISFNTSCVWNIKCIQEQIYHFFIKLMVCSFFISNKIWIRFSIFCNCIFVIVCQKYF